MTESSRRPPDTARSGATRRVAYVSPDHHVTGPTGLGSAEAAVIRARSPRPVPRRLLAPLLAVGLLLLALPLPPVAAQGGPSEVNVELILDASGSMAQRIGGETRMAIAK